MQVMTPLKNLKNWNLRESTPCGGSPRHEIGAGVNLNTRII